MCLGAFPIVSDIWANFEWILDGYNGFLFNPLIEEDIADKIMKCFKFEKFDEIREMNKKIVIQRANWEENFKNFLNFINNEHQNLKLYKRNNFPWNYKL